MGEVKIYGLDSYHTMSHHSCPWGHATEERNFVFVFSVSMSQILHRSYLGLERGKLLLLKNLQIEGIIAANQPEDPEPKQNIKAKVQGILGGTVIQDTEKVSSSFSTEEDRG